MWKPVQGRGRAPSTHAIGQDCLGPGSLQGASHQHGGGGGGVTAPPPASLSEPSRCRRIKGRMLWFQETFTFKITEHTGKSKGWLCDTTCGLVRKSDFTCNCSLISSQHSETFFFFFHFRETARWCLLQLHRPQTHQSQVSQLMNWDYASLQTCPTGKPRVLICHSITNGLYSLPFFNFLWLSGGFESPLTSEFQVELMFSAV